MIQPESFKELGFWMGFNYRIKFSTDQDIKQAWQHVPNENKKDVISYIKYLLEGNFSEEYLIDIWNKSTSKYYIKSNGGIKGAKMFYENIYRVITS